jgi:Flp pilus assembly protein TadD
MTTPDPYEEFRRAEIFFNAGQPAEACRILEPVMAVAPESTAGLELLARAQFASAQLNLAEVSLRELVARRPDDGWAHFALARTLERLGRRDEGAVHRRLAAALGVTGD